MIQFTPHVGIDYRSGLNGAKTLVLGLSHYGDEGDNHKNFTREVVEEHAYKSGNSFFTKITKVLLLSKDEPTDEERIAVWGSVAFYNYVQDLVGTESRISPTKEMWEKSINPFIEVIGDLKPQLIIVLGSQLWNELDHIPAIPDVEWCWIKHPSAPNFSYDESFNNYKKSLDSLKRKSDSI